MERFKHLVGSEEAVVAYTELVRSEDLNLIVDPIPHPTDETLWRTVLVDGFTPSNLTEYDSLSVDWFNDPSI